MRHAGLRRGGNPLRREMEVSPFTIENSSPGSRPENPEREGAKIKKSDVEEGFYYRGYPSSSQPVFLR